jgi:hypothetical protein
MISEIGRTFGMVIIDCKPDAVAVISNQTSAHA